VQLLAVTHKKKDEKVLEKENFVLATIPSLTSKTKKLKCWIGWKYVV